MLIKFVSSALIGALALVSVSASAQEKSVEEKFSDYVEALKDGQRQ